MDETDSRKQIPLWRASDGYPLWRSFFLLLSAYLTQYSLCAVFSVERPEDLLPIDTLINSTDANDVSKRNDLLAANGLTNTVQYQLASKKAWGLLVMCTKPFPEIQAIVIANHGRFVQAVLAITAHVQGSTKDHVADVKAALAEQFRAVSTKTELRLAILELSKVQRVLATVDVHSHEFTEEECHTFLVQQLRKPSLNLEDVHRQVRTPGNVSYDTFDKLKSFLYEILPRLQDDESAGRSAAPTIMHAASAERVHPRSRVTPRRPRLPRAPSTSSGNDDDPLCFKCGARQPSHREAALHARTCPKEVKCQHPNCFNPTSHQTAYHQLALRAYERRLARRARGRPPSSSSTTTAGTSPSTAGVTFAVHPGPSRTLDAEPFLACAATVVSAAYGLLRYVIGLDSMSSTHTVGDAALLIDQRPAPTSSATMTADGTLHYPLCIGTLPVLFADEFGQPVLILVSNVLAMASWPADRVLFSIGQLSQLRDPRGQALFAQTDEHLVFRLPSSTARVPYDRSRVHTVRPLALGPAALEPQPSLAAAATPPRPESISSRLAMARLCFVNGAYVKATVDHGDGLALTDDPRRLPAHPIEAQIHGMSRRRHLVHTPADLSQRVERNQTARRIQTLHMDIHGPFHRALNAARYFTSFLTDTRMTFVFFHKAVDQATQVRAFLAACLELGTPLEVRLDRNQTLVRNDPSYVTEFQQLCLDRGIALKVSPPGHQEMNGVAEKAGGRDIYEHATSMLIYSGISLRFWPFAVQHFVDVMNRVPRPGLRWESPFFLHYGLRPYLGDFLVFGCPVWIHLTKDARGAMAAFKSRAHRGIHLGRARDSPPRTWLVYDLITKALRVSRDLIFDENFELVTRTPGGWRFPESGLPSFYATIDADFPDDPPSSPSAAPSSASAVAPVAPAPSSTPPTATASSSTVPAAAVSSSTSTPATAPTSDDATVSDDDTTAPILAASEPEVPSPSVPDDTSDPNPPVADQSSTSPPTTLAEPSALRRSARTHAPPTRFDPQGHVPSSLWVDDSAAAVTSSDLPSVDFSSSGLTSVDSSSSDLAPVVTASSDLSTVVTASSDNAQVSSSSSDPAHVDSSSSAVPLALQAPLVVDYARADRRFHAFAAANGREAAEAAYAAEMNAIFEAQVFSEPEVPLPDSSVLPTQMLYRVKSNGTCKARIVCRGDQQQHGVDYDADTLYAPVVDSVTLRIILALAAAQCAFIHSVDINTAFLYGDMPPKFAVYVRPPPGVRLASHLAYRLRKALYGLRQAPSIFRNLLHQFLLTLGFVACTDDLCAYHRRSTSAISYLAVHVDDILIVSTDESTLFEIKAAIKARFKVKDQGSIHGNEFLGKQILYDQDRGILTIHCDDYLRRAIAELGIDLAALRPASSPLIKPGMRGRPPVDDVPLLASQLRQFSGILSYVSSACRPDLAVAASMLASTRWADITDLNSTTSLFGFADSDFAGSAVSAKSRSGHVLFLANSLIYWKSKLQPNIALSSTSAEIVSLTDLCRRLIPVTSLLSDLGFPQRLVPLYEDNKPAITITYNAQLSPAVRHMCIADLWVRELVRTDLCRVYYCATLSNLSDFMTKIVTGRPFTTTVLALSGYRDHRLVPPQGLAHDYNSSTTSSL